MVYDFDIHEVEKMEEFGMPFLSLGELAVAKEYILRKDVTKQEDVLNISLHLRKHMECLL